MKNKVISVFAHGSAKKLYIEFFDINGKKRQKSTGKADTKVNRRYIDQVFIPAFEKALLERSNPKIVPKHLSYYAQKYIDHLSASKHTKADVHTGRVMKILDFLGDNIFPEDVTELDVEDLVHSLDFSRDTVLDWLVVFRAIMDRALKDRAIKENVVRSYQLPKSIIFKTSEHERMPFSTDEASKILSNVPERLKNYFGIAFNLGLRSEETIALRINDIDFENMIVHVQKVISHGDYKLVSQQKGGPRKVPLFDNAEEYLKDQIIRAKAINSEFLFFDDEGKRLSDSVDIRGIPGADFFWNSFLTELNISPIRKMKNTRHTFAVLCIKSNKFTMQEIASMMGHTSLRMILHYYGKYIDDASKTVDRKIDIFKSN